MFDQVAQLVEKLLHVLELPVHRRESHVGNFVQFLQSVHDLFTDHRGIDFPLGTVLDHLLDLLDDEEKAKTFLRMEKWIHDNPDQAGECFRQFVKDLYQENILIEGKMRIGDRDVALNRITMPVLNLYASHDHIVPPSASLALEDGVATTDYTAWEFEGGHIGIYVSARAQQQVPEKIAEWLHARCPDSAEPSP